MCKSYIDSFFHFTGCLDNVIGILEKGFIPSYAKEQFIGSRHNVYHINIPMVSFTVIPLQQVDRNVYGTYGIGMVRKWGNKKKLSPVMYYHSNKRFIVSEYLKDVYIMWEQSSKKSDKRKHARILGCVKPVVKFKDLGYATGGKRLDNYIEQEWRKFYPSECLTDNEMKTYKSKNGGSKLLCSKSLAFNASDVSYIIVPNEEGIKSITSQIMNLNVISGKAVDDNEKKTLVQKVISLEQIKQDF